MIGPPVASICAHSSLKVMFNSGSVFELSTPFSISSESRSTSQIIAARSSILLLTSWAASWAAQPVANVTRLPPVPAVYPTESVSAVAGCTSSAAIPKTSAACMAIDVREPPMSVEPSTRLIVPSEFTEMKQLDGIPALNQKPIATPLPWLGPSSGSL